MRADARVARLRALLADNGLDAIVVRDVADIMWLTGFERVFDTERAHTLLLTQEAAALHTDSRYATALRSAAEAEGGTWAIDDARVSSAKFVAGQLAALDMADARVCIDAATPLSEYRALVAAVPDATLAERAGDVLALRAVKDEAEIAVMKRAQAIASAAFLAMLERLAPGMRERDVSLMLEMEMRERGADELAFANIVASGPNSANPHAVPGERTLGRGDFVVFDFGARIDGYRSDTTRTVCIGAPSAQQRRIYEAVRAANEEVERTIAPGVTGKAMHELAESVLAEHGFAGKMGHSLGHGVGLDIHEQPVLSPKNDAPLAEGNVVTVEPGVYLAGSDGARLEDCGVLSCGAYVNFCTLGHELMVVE